MTFFLVLAIIQFCSSKKMKNEITEHKDLYCKTAENNNKKDSIFFINYFNNFKVKQKKSIVGLDNGKLLYFQNNLMYADKNGHKIFTKSLDDTIIFRKKYKKVSLISNDKVITTFFVCESKKTTFNIVYFLENGKYSQVVNWESNRINSITDKNYCLNFDEIIKSKLFLLSKFSLNRNEIKFFFDINSLNGIADQNNSFLSSNCLKSIYFVEKFGIAGFSIDTSNFYLE